MQRKVLRMNDKRSKAWQWLRRGAAGILSLMLVFSLIQPGLASADETYICGKEAHAHTDACYEIKTETKTVEVLSCDPVTEAYADAEGETADFVVHTHADNCYEDETLVCDLDEVEVHTHEDACYETAKELQCTPEAAEGHEHTDGCYQKLICDEEEIILHTHAEACYITAQAEDGTEIAQLNCDETVLVAHEHTANCYTEETEEVEVKTLTCTVAEHAHDDSCKAKGPTAAETYEQKLADLENRVKALDVEAADFATKWDALFAEMDAIEKQLGADKGAGIITPEEYSTLFAKLDSVLNLLFENMPTGDGDGGQKERGTYAKGDPFDSEMDYNMYKYVSDKNGGLRENESKLTAYINNSFGGIPVMQESVSLSYSDVILGLKSAESVTVNIPSGIGTDASGVDGSEDSEFWSGVSAVNAKGENKDDIINGGYYVVYKDIGNRGNINLKVSVEDYQTINEITTDPKIALRLLDGKPGVSCLHIAWVRLKYEFFTEDQGTAKPVAVKGNTTYYDVDGSQFVHLNPVSDDSSCEGIYVPDISAIVTGSGHTESQLYIGNFDGENGYSTPGVAVFERLNYVDNDMKAASPYAFTEIFDTGDDGIMYRTFGFMQNVSLSTDDDAPDYKKTTDIEIDGVQKYHSDDWAGGLIWHDALPVNARQGKLKIEKKVENGDTAKAFQFDVELSYSMTGTFGDVTFADGKASFTLKDGQSKTIEGLYESTSVTITENTYADYDTSVSDSEKDESESARTYTKYLVVDDDTPSTTKDDVTTYDFGTVTFTNTRKTGKLTIEKVWAGNAVPAENPTPAFKVFVNDNEVAAESDGTYKINYGDTVKIEEVTTGVANYDVTWAVTGDNNTAIESTPATDGKSIEFVFGNNANVTVKCTNTQKGVLSITKELDTTNGALPEGYNPDFILNVKIGTTALPTGTPYTVSPVTAPDDGKRTVTTAGQIVLKAGQTAVIEQLPIGATYEVTEADASRIGFAVEYTNGTGTVTTDTAVTVKNKVSKTTVTIPISKLLLNHDKSAEGHPYYFAMYPQFYETMIAGPLPVTVKGNENSAQASFTLDYDTSDLLVNGEMESSRPFVYEIYEITEDGKAVSNTGVGALADSFAITQRQNVTVTLTGTTNGLAAKVESGGVTVTEENPVIFKNILLTDLTIQKQMEKDSVDIDGTYYMTVELASPHFKAGMVLDLGYKETGATQNKTYKVSSAEESAKKVILENIPVKVGEANAVTIKGIPYGSTYKITETSGYGYTVVEPEKDTGTVGNGTVATVTNAEMPAVTEKIKVKKSLPNSDGGKYSYKFALTEVELKDGVLVESANKSNNQIKKVEFKGKEGEVSFDALTYKTSDLLNVDAVNNTKQKVFYYRITEIPAEDELVMSIDETEYIVKVLLTAGTHTLDAKIVGVEQDGKDLDDLNAITFNNTLLGSLTVNKRVVGGDKDHAFKFTMTVDKAISGDYYAEVNGKETTFTIKNGVADFWLCHKDEITIYGLPHGLEVEIYEHAGDYYPYHKVDSQRIYAGRAVKTVFDSAGTTVKYTNYADEDMLPQTGQLKWPILVLGVLGAGFLGFGVLTKKRKRNGK